MTQRNNQLTINPIECNLAPHPLGNYSHAMSYGDFVFVSGIASRDFETDKIPGLQLDDHGNKIAYDIRQETKATLENIKKILHSADSDLEHILEVSTFLLHMSDFPAYNEIYAQYFSRHRPARTTVGVRELPGHVNIEIKVVAVRKS